MIKVLRHGHPVKYIVDCDACNAQLEFTQQDIKHSNGYVPVSYIVCPDCGRCIMKEHFKKKEEKLK